MSGVGTLISFSTQPGNVALDGRGRNSPFAGALAKRLAAPKDDLSALLIDVRNDVMMETQNKQVPWEHSALRGRFYFISPSAPTVTAQAPTYSAAAEAARVCREVDGITSQSVLAVLANQHKGTPAGDCIAARMDELKKQQVAVASPPQAVQPTPPPSAKPAVQVAPAPTMVPGTVFRDCPYCPEMVVVAAGSFTMGSNPAEIAALEKQHSSDHYRSEGPQRKVTIARPFAVGKFEVTFAEWEACAAGGGCVSNKSPSDQGLGQRPSACDQCVVG